MNRDDDHSGPRPDGQAGSSDGAAGASSAGLLRLTDHRPADPSRLVDQLTGYWRSLRRGRAIPERADIEPRGIREALDYAFILERIAPGAARFRLAGRHLLDLMGMEVRGMPLCAVIEPAARGRFSDVVETVFRAPQIAELTLHATPGYARPALDGRMLLLPLRSDLGDVTRALGCLITSGETGRAPRRFGIVAERLEAVIDGALVMPPSPSAPEMPDSGVPWTYPVADAMASPTTNALRSARNPADFGDRGPVDKWGKPVRGNWRAQDRADPSAPAGDGPERDATSPASGSTSHQSPAPAATPEARRAMFRVVASTPDRDEPSDSPQH